MQLKAIQREINKFVFSPENVPELLMFLNTAKGI